MADGSWLQIYRGYSTEELLSERASLRANLSAFSSQTVGTKSFTRDQGTIKARLEAVQFVLNERSNPGIDPSRVVVDFAGLTMTGGSDTGDFLH